MPNRYKAVCKDCNYITNYDYIRPETAQWFAEIHMMQSGHIVEIEERFARPAGE